MNLQQPSSMTETYHRGRQSTVCFWSTRCSACNFTISTVILACLWFSLSLCIWVCYGNGIRSLKSYYRSFCSLGSVPSRSVVSLVCVCAIAVWTKWPLIGRTWWFICFHISEKIMFTLVCWKRTCNPWAILHFINVLNNNIYPISVKFMSKSLVKFKVTEMFPFLAETDSKIAKIRFSNMVEKHTSIGNCNEVTPPSETVRVFLLLSCIYNMPCIQGISLYLYAVQSELFVHDACVRGSVFHWRHCDTLCTSGFVNDIMFSQSELCGASCALLSGESVTADTASIQTKFCARMRISQYTSRVAHRGEVCCLLPCLMLYISMSQGDSGKHKEVQRQTTRESRNSSMKTC